MEDIKRSAQLFIERNGIVEVRVIANDTSGPKKKIIASGYYNNVDALVHEVEKVDSNTSVKGIYITLNKPKAEHTQKLNQPISRSTKKLSDKHMERVTSLLIDLDPERETDTNSTAGELEAARLRCLAVGDALTKEGFPESSNFMSGNGHHLDYAINLPVEDKPLVRDFLKALDHKFSDDVVKVDTSVYNPARITKLYGTMTRKGPDTPQRPQRRSTIESIPDNIVEVTREQLQMVVEKWGAQKNEESPLTDFANLPAPIPLQRTHHATRTPVDVPSYCQKAGLEIVGTKVDSGSTIYKLKECAFNPEHRDNDASIILGVDGIIRYQCFHNSCQGRTFQEACNQLGVKPDEWADDEFKSVTLFDTQEVDEQAPFPAEALPEVLLEAVTEAARFIKVSPVSPTIVGISVLATAIGKKAIVIERRGLTHHPALFLMGVAGPSERKTPSFTTMTTPLERWAEDQQEDYAADIARAKSKNSVIDVLQKKLLSKLKPEISKAEQDKIEREISAHEADRLPTPAYPRPYTTDPTEQRLFQMMEQRGGAYAALSGEGRQVINQILGRFSDGTGEAIYLAGITGDTITRDRVGNEKGPEEKAIPHPCLNVCVMVQPDKDLELSANPTMKASGLNARIWRVRLPITAGTREEAPDEEGLNYFKMERYDITVRSILDTLREEPHKARLSREVKEARRLFHNEIERQLRPRGALSNEADIAGKCCSQTVKLALVYHFTEHPELLSEDDSEIDIATWAKAEVWGRFFLSESVRLRRSVDEDQELETCRKIAHWLITKKIKNFTQRELMRTGPRPRLKKIECPDILNMMVEYGAVRETGKGVYEVNPSLKLSPLSPTSPAPPLENKQLKIDPETATTATMATNEIPIKETSERVADLFEPQAIHGEGF